MWHGRWYNAPQIGSSTTRVHPYQSGARVKFELTVRLIQQLGSTSSQCRMRLHLPRNMPLVASLHCTALRYSVLHCTALRCAVGTGAACGMHPPLCVQHAGVSSTLELTRGHTQAQHSARGISCVWCRLCIPRLHSHAHALLAVRVCMIMLLEMSVATGGKRPTSTFVDDMSCIQQGARQQQPNRSSCVMLCDSYMQSGSD